MRRILPTLFALLWLNASAKEHIHEQKGKPIVTVFTNFHTAIGKSENNLGFELSRCYLGYEYRLTPDIKLTGILDVGQSKQVDDQQRLAYLKSMMVEWRHRQLTLKAGLIPTLQFGYQEKFWGLRFMHKSFQDEYKFGDSADLGISVSYAFNSRLTADAIIANGEGYKKLQLNGGLLFGAGITATPFSRLSLRLYGGINQSVGEAKKDIYTLATFIGYKYSFLSVGAEYNMKKEKGGTDSALPQGFSLYSSARMNKHISLFGRYDQLFTSTDGDFRTNEQKAIAGAQFTITKNIRLAPAFTYTHSTDNNNKPKYLVGIYCFLGI